MSGSGVEMEWCGNGVVVVAAAVVVTPYQVERAPGLIDESDEYCGKSPPQDSVARAEVSTSTKCRRKNTIAHGKWQRGRHEQDFFGVVAVAPVEQHGRTEAQDAE